jgi:four helix bundle protein
MRDHTKLEVFELADQVALTVYRETVHFPPQERYGLQSQLRRAAVSVASNIVEGCARHSEADYVRFLDIAYGSARELQYQLSLCTRLGLMRPDAAKQLTPDCIRVTKALSGLLRALRVPK